MTVRDTGAAKAFWELVSKSHFRKMVPFWASWFGHDGRLRSGECATMPGIQRFPVRMGGTSSVSTGKLKDRPPVSGPKWSVQLMKQE